jgi:FKBP-type peptidyl-prolyl cis-trans isomerase FklB
MFGGMDDKNRHSRHACALMALIAAPAWAGAQTADRPTPDSAAADEALYTMGVNLGRQLSQNGVSGDIPLSRIDQGVKDGLAGKAVSAAQQMRLQAYLRSAAETAAARNAAAAHEYLERNAKTSGVTTTPSGLQYKIIEPGDPNADSPRSTDLVSVSFRGSLLDGRQFDSSSTPGSAATVQVNGVMRAWTEALTLMKPGARWQLFVPPELGYGQATRLGVPGGSLLIYDLTLLRVMTAATPASAGGPRPP